MIEDHKLRLRLRLRIRLRLPGVRLLAVAVLKAFAGLRLPRYRHRSDDARAAGHRREFLEPPLAEHRRTVDLVALLRYRADDLVTERIHQTAQLFDACGVRDVIDARKLDADQDRTRNGRFGFHGAALAGSVPGFRFCHLASSCTWPPLRWHLAVCARPMLRRSSLESGLCRTGCCDDAGGRGARVAAVGSDRSRGFADRIHCAAPRRNGAAAFMDGSRLDDKAAPSQRLAKGLVGRGLLRINPDNQHAVGTQEAHQPIKRWLNGIEGAPPPIDERYVVLAGRMAAVCRSRCVSVAEALQLEHQFDAPGAGYDDPVLFQAMCKRDHRFDDSIACRSSESKSHDVTIGSDDCLKLLRDGLADPRPAFRSGQACALNVQWSLPR